jgi:hypothetical protein
MVTIEASGGAYEQGVGPAGGSAIARLAADWTSGKVRSTRQPIAEKIMDR